MFIIIILLLVIAVVVFARLGGLGDESVGSKEYLYKKRGFLLSRAEHECYNAILKAVNQEYYVFPQVHLPTIVDSKITGQNWKGAFRHISQKSVDFVLCDKAYIAPKLAIELDDSTHERAERKERDQEVERILKVAGMPLLRLRNNGSFDPNELAQQIKTALLD